MKRQHSRKKELSEVQTLKLENRILRSENTQLRKQVKRLERKDHYNNNVAPYTDSEAQLDFFATEEDNKNICLSCNKGTLIYVNVVGRQWQECNQCSYDSRKK